MNNLFDKIYCINLDKRKDKWEECKKEFEKFSIDSVCRISALDGEKLFETLISREEMLRSDDLGDYFRIPPDSRDLNYNQYFVEGEKQLSEMNDYTSHNTELLNKESIISLLLELDSIKTELNS